MKDYYEILGASRTASREELKQCYHNLIRKYHPDKNTDQTSTDFHMIDEAWKILSDEILRRNYDVEVQTRENMSTFPVHNEIKLSTIPFDSVQKQYKMHCRCGGYYILDKSDISDCLLLVSCDNCSLTIEIDCCT